MSMNAEHLKQLSESDIVSANLYRIFDGALTLVVKVRVATDKTVIYRAMYSEHDPDYVLDLFRSKDKSIINSELALLFMNWFHNSVARSLELKPEYIKGTSIIYSILKRVNRYYYCET